MNWLSDLLHSTSELEAPSNFYYWAGLTAISAVLKDSVWINRGEAYNLYPNIYVMLHAESGLKKGPPINLCKDLVKRANVTRIISGRASIQGILKRLGSNTTAPGGKLEFGGKSVAYIVSSELTSSLVDDKAAADILTDLYDRIYNVGAWESLLKMEEFSLKDPTITMLTATNEAHSSDFFGRKDIQGGYFARTFVIAETKRNRLNSLVMPMRNPPDRNKLSEYLVELSKLTGPFVPLGIWEADGSATKTPAGKLYDDWYTEFMEFMDSSGMKDETGTINRFGDSVLKVAMLLQLSKGLSMEITLDTMEEAIKKCSELIGNIRRVMMGRNGNSSYAQHKVLIIQELINRPNHMISRAQLLDKFKFYGNSDEWDKVMTTLIDGEIVRQDTGMGVIVYIMPDDKAAELGDFMMNREKK